eukprot:CAMPEP_0194766830 /NCGR_PEP_ID=MMETSP0323_2-20130528/33366_1 /TAXON_ID=2866 ORGANISM="Crypthecodinium cohnii, Strain Seligo" /NCGR_SAMPLE_ID=MMETSP0323_2 /ASSEMBLY_ACC=CAM_ASM_000346 /LENGTH=169 /DNA_ID=CAMNT_0039698101 /DNA_START=22 /DNA_END=531 /DNA_ORIENTATION=+
MAATLVAEVVDTTPVAQGFVAEEPQTVLFKVSGSPAFELELELGTAVRDVKKVAKEVANVEPEHMRLIYNGRLLKESDTLECYKAEDKTPVMIHFTAGHEALVGGGSNRKVQQNPFVLPVRGLPGSKGQRVSRVSGRPGGMGLIRKYGILMKRQEFREKAEEIGFVKYR